MVAELHKAGFQLLRVMPHLHDIGTWRLALAPRDWFSPQYGLVIRAAHLGRAPQFSSADQNQPFGWRHAAGDSARDLAAKFLKRFPELAHATRGRDWLYAGWFTELMGWVDAGYLPFANPEGLHDWEDRPDFEATPLIAPGGERLTGASRCPLPPPLYDPGGADHPA
jgi:hypothetical protein